MIFGGEKYAEHPDTNFRFEEFEVPYAQESKDLCAELSNCLPNRLIGWDIAITNKEPVVIERNIKPYLLMGGMGYKGYIQHLLFKEILTNVKLQSWNPF